MDWTGCDAVETVPGKLGGAVVLKGTRVSASSVVESAELGESPEEIAFNYDLNVGEVRRVLAYASKRGLVSAT
jgi:uncharacterized protein (DUF433 family)